MRYGIGLDVGIASVGYAVMELDNDDDKPFRIINLGARVFDAAENHKDGSSLAVPRREARSMRRRLRRKRHRKERIRQLIISHGLLTKDQLDKLYDNSVSDIYELRCNALDRLVTNEELARIMLHIAQRRGFRSNRRHEKKDSESGKLLKAIQANQDEMAKNQYRTVGEMFFLDERYKSNKRNKAENYLNTVSRDMVLAEVSAIFNAQRKMCNPLCHGELEDEYTVILSLQRSFEEGPGAGHAKSPSPYAGSQIEKMVGICTFEGESERRAAKASYSFERFDLLQKINHIRLEESGRAFPLTEEQRLIIIGEAHKKDSLNFKQIRKLLLLPEHIQFNHIKYDPKSTIETDEGKVKLNCLKAYHEMRKVLDDGVKKDRILSLSTAQRNTIGYIFTVYKNEKSLRTALIEAGFDLINVDALINNLGSFTKFSNLSIKALDNLIPHLEKGMTYNQACDAAGYNFKGHDNAVKTKLISLRHLADEAENTITSPVVRRAISQCAKVINAIIREMSKSPVYINVELGREMANTFEERKMIDKDNKENQARNERIKKRINEEFGKLNPTGLDIVKLGLYEEQRGECLYAQKPMDITKLFDPGYVEIDHIIPYSISFNDTKNNKVLVFANENRQKGNRLPLQYLTGKRRDDFIVYINTSHLKREKKNALMKEEITEDEANRWKERALQDTKTMSRFLYNYLTDFLEFSNFESGRKKHVNSVNGRVTSLLRSRWGLNKVREDGDTHHAMDAVVIACTTPAMINMVSRHFKYNENKYKPDFKLPETYIDKHGEIIERFPPPYERFRDELMARLSDNPRIAIEGLRLLTYPEQDVRALRPIFVSRMPSRKVSGAAHKETVKGITESGWQVKKVALSALKLDKNGEIDGYYNPADDTLLYNALKERLSRFGGSSEKAFTEPFYKPKSDGSPGSLVKKVKVLEKSTLNVGLHKKDDKPTGSADHDSMVRVDVFYVEGEGYYLVPIYVADTLKDVLPNKAIVAHKPYEQWKEMNDNDFIFSLHSNDLIFIQHKKQVEFVKTQKESNLTEKVKKESSFVYYKSTGIAVGTITVINHDNSYCIKSLGVKTLVTLEKYQADVLGNLSKVNSEPRKDFSERKK